MSRAAFSVCDVKRLIKVAKDSGMSVDKMGLIVEEGRITLLPPANDGGLSAIGSGAGYWDDDGPVK